VPKEFTTKAPREKRMEAAISYYNQHSEIDNNSNKAFAEWTSSYLASVLLRRERVEFELFTDEISSSAQVTKLLIKSDLLGIGIPAHKLRFGVRHLLDRYSFFGIIFGGSNFFQQPTKLPKSDRNCAFA
jgi:hypothetical protein